LQEDRNVASPKSTDSTSIDQENLPPPGDDSNSADGAAAHLRTSSAGKTGFDGDAADAGLSAMSAAAADAVGLSRKRPSMTGVGMPPSKRFKGIASSLPGRNSTETLVRPSMTVEDLVAREPWFRGLKGLNGVG
jgi:hypothetical protein